MRRGLLFVVGTLLLATAAAPAQSVGTIMLWSRMAAAFRDAATPALRQLQANPASLGEDTARCLSAAYGVGQAASAAQALVQCRQAAQAKSAWAEMALGRIYLLGEGVPSDAARGLLHLQRATMDGAPVANFLMGMVYEHGSGAVAADTGRALTYFEQGAKLGDARCESQLGWMYAVGFGLKPDQHLAAQWFQKAAVQGEPVGEDGLGIRYLYGRGERRDLARAEHWFLLAAAQGHGDAAYDLGILYGGLDKGWPHAPSWIRAAHYFTLAAQQGIYDAQCMLGQLYASGHGVPRDPVRGFAWMALSQPGSHICDAHIASLRQHLTPSQMDAARDQVQSFHPTPHLFSYGTFASH